MREVVSELFIYYLSVKTKAQLEDVPCSRSLARGPSEKPMILVAGEDREVVRLAAGAADRVLSALELPALFDVKDAPNLQ